MLRVLVYAMALSFTFVDALANKLWQRQVIQNLIDNTEEGGTVRLPSGVYEIEFGAGDQVEIRKDIRIEGSRRSVLDVYPKQPDFAFRTFYITDGANVTFADFTLIGPDLDTDYILSEPEVQGIWGWVNGDLILENVTIRGKYRTAIYNTCLDGSKFRLRDCEIEAGEVAVACYGRPDFVDIQGGRIGPVMGFHGGRPRGVGFYTHKHVNFKLKGVEFKDISLLASQVWEVGGRDSAMFNVYDGCRFVVTDSLLLANIWGGGTWTNERTLTEYCGCLFWRTAGAITAVGNVKISGTRFIKCNVHIEVKRDSVKVWVTDSEFQAWGQNPVIWSNRPAYIHVNDSYFWTEERVHYWNTRQSFIAVERGAKLRLSNSTLDGRGKQNQGIYVNGGKADIGLTEIMNCRENAIKTVGGETVNQYHVVIQ